MAADKSGMLTIQELQEAFYNFDENKRFTLTMDELRRIVSEEGDPLPPSEVSKHLN